MNEKDRWNLRKMYPTDEDWNHTLEQALKLAGTIEGRKGQCADTAETFLETVEQYMELDQKLYDLMVFANSNFDQDMSDVSAKQLYEKAQNAATQIGEKLSFLAPELMQYDYTDFERYCEQCPQLEVYAHYAKDFFAKKEHTLSDAMEGLLVRMNDIGASFCKIFEDLMINDVAFPMIQAPDGSQFRASEAGYHTAMGSPDREFRKNYFEALLGTYGKYQNTLTSAYYGAVKDDVFTAKTRHFASSRAMKLFANHIPEEVYDNLLKTVREHTGPLQDYVQYRKEKMKLDEIHFYDLFVPIVPQEDRRYTYEEAQELVRKATAVLGEDYTQLIDRAFSERWIDVYPADNKKTGAYSTGSYTSAPYVLLNFTGTLDDVFTLAHELGHSMHTYFSCQNQPYCYSSYSIFCAEVASTLNELLLSDYLYRHAESQNQKKLLLDKKLNDLRSTFYRQVMFADFEDQTHRMVENGTPLLADTLGKLHADLNRIYYGKGFIVDPQLAFEWSRIPHFYSSFYVYQYATGIAAATAISKRILSGEEYAVEDYRAFLCGGSSRHPIEMLRVAGVDMASPQPILDTIEEFKLTLERLKQI
jgi:oligoendopeptidase F